MDYLKEGIAWRSVLIMMADQVSYKSGTSEEGNKGGTAKKKTTITTKEELREKIKADARLWE